jgi:hypothetical protein
VSGASQPDEPRFHLRAFTPRAGYAAAIALDRQIGALELFEWTGEAVPQSSKPQAREAPRA